MFGAVWFGMPYFGLAFLPTTTAAACLTIGDEPSAVLVLTDASC